jgi:hypothetical protein
MRLLRKRWLVAVFAICFAAAGAVWAALGAATPNVELAAWVPQGALLSLESQDFASLLKSWISSPEKAAWMKSDNYGVFSRSRLFTRLQEAQADFAGAAGLPVDGDLLQETAGGQTFFAWYDIGELQVVYITKMTPAQVSQSRLWQRRKNFEARQAGGVTFYVKTGGAAETSNDPLATTDAAAVSSGGNRNATKTVAFAESGDWLVLATREDLMAQTLELMAAKGDASENSLAQQGWYKDARAAAAGPEGDLRMVLNMERVVKTPQFRTYWIQQNVTEMKRYKAVVADLYRDAGGMREERVLLPQSESAPGADSNLGPMAALAPDHTVIYRATAKPTAADALQALQTKVLDRGVAGYEDTTVAPAADISTPQAGSASDLETRIDEPVAASAANGGSVSPLASLLQGASLDGMMTVDRNSADGKAEGIWAPFASAVVLVSAKDWDVHAVQDAVQQTVQAKLTVGSLGTAWQVKSAGSATYFAMNDARSLQLYVSGQLCIVADDPLLLAEMIGKQSQAKSAKPQPAMLLAGFDHSAARPGFAQWTRIIDGLSVKSAGPAGDVVPTFFGADMKSLSDAFAAMKQEQFIAWHDGAVVRQRVSYTWQR